MSKTSHSLNTWSKMSGGRSINSVASRCINVEVFDANPQMRPRGLVVEIDRGLPNRQGYRSTRAGFMIDWFRTELSALGYQDYPSGLHPYHVQGFPDASARKTRFSYTEFPSFHYSRSGLVRLQGLAEHHRFQSRPMERSVEKHKNLVWRGLRTGVRQGTVRKTTASRSSSPQCTAWPSSVQNSVQVAPPYPNKMDQQPQPQARFLPCTRSRYSHLPYLLPRTHYLSIR